MTKRIGTLRIAAITAAAIWLVAQIILVVATLGMPQYSDAANYTRFAHEAVDAASWYPTISVFNDSMWVANTGYINFLALNLRLFGTLKLVGFEQILFNILLLWSFVALVRRFAGDRTALAAAIIFCLLPSNAMVVPALMSDLLCMSLLMASLAIMRRRLWTLAAAGLLCGIANWVRPITLVFLPSILLYALYTRTSIKYYIPYALGLAVVWGATSLLALHSCGHPLSGSTTKGTNMIMGCFDGADGGYCDDAFLPGNAGYIDPALHYNVVQTDSALTRRSVDWIMQNPGRFAALAPAKVYRLWGGDVYSHKLFIDGEDTMSTPLKMLLSIPYYIMLLLAVGGLWLWRRKLWGIAGIIILPVLAGTAMHMLMYGGMRYHYPMMPCLIFFAAVALSRIATGLNLKFKGLMV